MMRSLISLTSRVVQCCTVQEEGRKKSGRMKNGGRAKGGREEQRGGEVHMIVCHCREVVYLYLGSVNTVPPFFSPFLSCW